MTPITKIYKEYDMKKIFLISAFVLLAVAIHAQVFTNKQTQPTIPNSNAMLDGSTSFSAEAMAPNNIGKGIVMPSVDLINFEFTDIANGIADGTFFPSYFDGMIVYNRSTGTTLTAGNRSSTATDVTPGFYYFSNPTGATTGTVTSGVWKPLGGGGGSGGGTGATYTYNYNSTTHTMTVSGSDGSTQNVIFPADADTIVGNEVTNATDATLVRAG